MGRNTNLIAVIFLSLVCSCQIGPDYAPPEIEVPERFDAIEQPGEIPPVDTWWENFNDPVLTRCIEEAISANKDLKVSVQRIRMARAMRRLESSRFWPDIDTDLSYTVDRLSENNPRFQKAIEGGLFPRDVEYWDIGFDVYWEIDVFGGTRRRVEGAVARIEEEAFQRLALMISVTAEVARNYFEIMGNRHKLEILDAKIANEDARIQIIDKKHRAELIPAGKILKHQTVKKELQSLKPTIEAEIKAGRYRLAVLLGRRPEDVVPGLDQLRPLPIAAATVPVGLPSDLLRRRPDILAADRKLAAATADIGVASAEFFPRFFLTGSPGVQSGNFSDLFSSASTAWVFGPSVSWKIFSSGRNKAQLEAARALQEQALIEYEISVNKALEDVESNLIRYANGALSLKFLAEAMETRHRDMELQSMRHQSGITDYIGVTDATTALLDAEWNRLGQEVVLLTRMVSLYKSLGGGWDRSNEIEF